jgi:hypothetical protein
MQKRLSYTVTINHEGDYCPQFTGNYKAAHDKAERWIAEGHATQVIQHGRLGDGICCTSHRGELVCLLPVPA